MKIGEATLRTQDIGRPAPSAEVLDRLEAAGHARVGFCEKCWGDAYRRSLSQTEKVQSDHYLDLLDEAEALA